MEMAAPAPKAAPKAQPKRQQQQPEEQYEDQEPEEPEAAPQPPPPDVAVRRAPLPVRRGAAAAAPLASATAGRTKGVPPVARAANGAAAVAAAAGSGTSNLPGAAAATGGIRAFAGKGSPAAMAADKRSKELTPLPPASKLAANKAAALFKGAPAEPAAVGPRKLSAGRALALPLGPSGSKSSGSSPIRGGVGPANASVRSNGAASAGASPLRGAKGGHGMLDAAPAGWGAPGFGQVVSGAGCCSHPTSRSCACSTLHSAQGTLHRVLHSAQGPAICTGSCTLHRVRLFQQPAALHC